MRITTKLYMIISLLLLVLFFFLTWNSYRHNMAMMLQESVEKARTIAKQALATSEYLSATVENSQLEQNYKLVPQVATTNIMRHLTDGTPYYVRQISNRYRNPANKPDNYELKKLNQLANDDNHEQFEIVKLGSTETLRYLLPMTANSSCLGCHGSFEKAPRFVQQHFPKGHSSYGYSQGEPIGAISISIPLDELRSLIANNLFKEQIIQGAVLLLVLFAAGRLIHVTVLSPVSKVAKGIASVTRTGTFATPIETKSKGEIGNLVESFNELMLELERRTRQRTEADERYRNFIEIAISPIVTFLPDGKIVITNKKAEKLLGLEKEELLGQAIFDFMKEPEELKQGIADYLADGRSQILGVASKQTLRDLCGHYFEVEMVISVSQSRQEAMFTAILRQLGQQKTDNK